MHKPHRSPPSGWLASTKQPKTGAIAVVCSRDEDATKYRFASKRPAGTETGRESDATAIRCRLSSVTEKKGRTKAEVDAIISWLTGDSARRLADQLQKQKDLNRDCMDTADEFDSIPASFF